MDEKTRSETLEVDTLKAKADEMLASGQQFHAANQAKEILDKLDNLQDQLKVRTPIIFLIKFLIHLLKIS